MFNLFLLNIFIINIIKKIASVNTNLSTGTSTRTYIKTVTIDDWQSVVVADIMLFINGVNATNDTKDLSYGCELTNNSLV